MVSSNLKEETLVLHAAYGTTPKDFSYQLWRTPVILWPCALKHQASLATLHLHPVIPYILSPQHIHMHISSATSLARIHKVEQRKTIVVLPSVSIKYQSIVFAVRESRWINPFIAVLGLRKHWSYCFKIFDWNLGKKTNVASWMFITPQSTQYILAHEGRIKLVGSFSQTHNVFLWSWSTATYFLINHRRQWAG